MMKNVYFICTVVIVTLSYVAAYPVSNFIENDGAAAETGEVPIIFKRLFQTLQRMENDEPIPFGYDDHYMMRKSQRSPSFRLRFGRSSPYTESDKVFKYFPVLYRHPENHEVN